MSMFRDEERFAHPDNTLELMKSVAQDKDRLQDQWDKTVKPPDMVAEVTLVYPDGHKETYTMTLEEFWERAYVPGHFDSDEAVQPDVVVGDVQ